MAENVRFIDRKDWQPGPWDDEPDLLHEPPILLLRQSNGGWGAMVAISKEHADNAREFIAKQGKVKLDNREHELALIGFDKQTRGAEHFDYGKLYIGFFYDRPEDLRPAATQFVRELPPEFQEQYMAQARHEYVTAERALMYVKLLARVLHHLKIPVEDGATQFAKT